MALMKKANNDYYENDYGVRYATEERIAAMNFVKFLYSEWRESEKNSIIKVDKTIYDNEESTNIN